MKNFYRIISPRDIWITECGLEVGDILEVTPSPSGEVLFFIKDGEVLRDPQGQRVWTDTRDIEEGFLELVEEGVIKDD